MPIKMNLPLIAALYHRGVNLFGIRHFEKGKYGAMQLNVFKTSMLKFKISSLPF
jgi:hypothetical protein